MSAQGASRLADLSACHACALHGPAATSSRNVQTNSRGSLRMGDHGDYPGCCGKAAPVRWAATVGAASVWINREPAVARTHATRHASGSGAMIGASGNVVIGGATISAEALARADALAMVEKGLASLARWNEADRRRFREWFGSDSEATRQLMRERLLKMRDKLTREQLVPGDDAHAYAHVYPDSNTVNLDGKFWSAPRDGENSRAGTLVHETTHFTDAGGTDDHAYGPTKCRALAAQYPSKAQDNADNHEYWMESLP